MQDLIGRLRKAAERQRAMAENPDWLIEFAACNPTHCGRIARRLARDANLALDLEQAAEALERWAPQFCAECGVNHAPGQNTLCPRFGQPGRRS